MLIDLDGTLVGKVGNVVCEYEVARLSGRKELRAFKESLVARLRYGIIRPHVHAFCKQSTPGLELFVYTASDAAWAAFLVPCVEAALGFKFQRPIFTRAHCVGPENKKSLAGVRPAVFARLRRAYKLLPSAVRDLNMVLVDNTPDVMADPAEQASLVVCPTYSYAYYYDVLGRVDVDTLHRRFARFVPCLTQVGLFPAAAAAPKSYQEFAAVYYRMLGAALADTYAGNAVALTSDHFWARMLQITARVTTFDADTVRSVNAALRKKR